MYLSKTAHNYDSFYANIIMKKESFTYREKVAAMLDKKRVRKWFVFTVSYVHCYKSISL